MNKALLFWAKRRPAKLLEAIDAYKSGQTCAIGHDPDDTVVQVDTEFTECICRAAQEAVKLEGLINTVFPMSERQREQTFDSLEKYGQPAQWLTMMQAVQAAKSIVEMPVGHQWLVLHGSYGCGKSHLLTAIRNSLPGLSIYIETHELSDMFFESVGDRNLYELKELLVQIPVLLLDDLGAEYNGARGFVDTQMTNIINGRYKSGIGKTTVIATNLNPADAETPGQETLRSRYPRLADRILDKRISQVQHIKLPSYRRK